MGYIMPEEIFPEEGFAIKRNRTPYNKVYRSRKLEENNVAVVITVKKGNAKAANEIVEQIKEAVCRTNRLQDIDGKMSFLITISETS